LFPSIPATGTILISPFAPQRANLQRFLYLFSGVRPSSGAASSNSARMLDFPGAAPKLDAAAPEDGRIPVSRYRFLIAEREQFASS